MCAPRGGSPRWGQVLRIRRGADVWSRGELPTAAGTVARDAGVATVCAPGRAGIPPGNRAVRRLRLRGRGRLRERPPMVRKVYGGPRASAAHPATLNHEARADAVDHLRRARGVLGRRDDEHLGRDASACAFTASRGTASDAARGSDCPAGAAVIRRAERALWPKVFVPGLHDNQTQPGNPRRARHHRGSTGALHAPRTTMEARRGCAQRRADQPLQHAELLSRRASRAAGLHR